MKIVSVICDALYLSGLLRSVKINSKFKIGLKRFAEIFIIENN